MLIVANVYWEDYSLEVGKTYDVVVSDNSIGMHIEYDTVECLDILPKTYRVMSKRNSFGPARNTLGRVYLLKKQNIIEIKEVK